MKELVFFPVVKKLDNFLLQERKFLLKNREGLLSLRNSLEQLKLNHKECEDGAKNVEDVVQYAYNVEDYIDNLAVAFENWRSNASGGKYLIGPFKLPTAEEIDLKVNELKNELHMIQNMEVQVPGEETRRSMVPEEETSHSIVPEEPFPFEFSYTELQNRLRSSESDRLLIAVVGMGGLGKTFLVKRAVHQYYDGRSDKLFAWVHVSKDYKIPNLLREVIKAFNMNSAPQKEELDMMETEELGLYLHESLVERPYVVVLDDVWDSEVWAHLRRALPNNKLCSRVVITTHIRSLIDESGVEKTQVYEYPGADQLHKDLLQFLKHHHEIPEPVANGLISQCNGLFVDLICVRKLLGTSLPKDLENASNDSRHLWDPSSSSFLSKISPILDLSFNDLHHHLKLCYLYLALFPANCEIKVDKLVRLWVAEGFIKSGKGGTLEEVAMDYVNELGDRSLIQIEKRNVTRISTFRVHPCLRALLLKKSKELKLLQDFSAKNIGDAICSWFRKVAFHCGFMKDFTTDDKTRTVMVFSKEDDTVAKLSKVEDFKTLSLLQVLDLEGTWFSASHETGKTTLPDVVKNLVLLRYLGLNDTYIDDLPPSIKTLRALQTLYLDREILVSIPNEINELKRLRHLFGRLKWPFEVKNLRELQTLGYIENVDPWKFYTGDLPKLKGLLKLRELYVDLSCGWIYNLGPIGSLTTLQSLCLKLNRDVELETLPECGNLLQLKLKGETSKLPDNMHEILPNLRYLYVGSNSIHLRSLAKLAKLTILDLYRCKIQDSTPKDESFPRLEILQLIKCSFTNYLTVSDTTVPLLKEFLINPKDERISLGNRLGSLPAPKNWRHPNDDDWPYYPRTMP